MFQNKDIAKDDYWMAIALLIGANPNSANNQGCVIVDNDNKIIASGYTTKLVDKNKSNLIHAELNAMLNLKSKFYFETAYITHTPCKWCVFAFIAAGVSRAIYLPTEELDSNIIFDSSSFVLSEYKGNLNWTRDYFNSII